MYVPSHSTTPSEGNDLKKRWIERVGNSPATNDGYMCLILGTKSSKNLRFKKILEIDKERKINKKRKKKERE